MATMDDFVAGLLSGNAPSLQGVNVNNNERDGNSADLLFRIDQPTIGITGGASSTTISPFTASIQNPAQALADLTAGRFNVGVLIWIAIVAFGGWLLLKK